MLPALHTRDYDSHCCRFYAFVFFAFAFRRAAASYAIFAAFMPLMHHATPMLSFSATPHLFAFDAAFADD